MFFPSFNPFPFITTILIIFAALINIPILMVLKRKGYLSSVGDFLKAILLIQINIFWRTGGMLLLFLLSFFVIVLLPGLMGAVLGLMEAALLPPKGTLNYNPRTNEPYNVRWFQ